VTAFTLHIVVGAAVFLLTLAIRATSINSLVRRKLRLSFFLAIVYVVASTVLGYAALSPAISERVVSVLQLCLALAIINLVVVAVINPLRVDRVPERFPTILQDTVIIGLFFIVATLVMQEKFLTTSAVGAVVIGFALQDTLGNMFSGLAIQIEKPFQLGNWVAVGQHEGQVCEVTWRAIKLRTKSGNLVVLPNAAISKEAIVNYSQPAAPTRLQVEVGVSYAVPPNQVKAALLEAAANASMVLADPPPEALMEDFGSSAILYRVRFWIDDYARDQLARDQVRSGIYYSLRRHGYEIPYPIQVEIPRLDEGERASERINRISKILEPVSLFAPLSREERNDLAARAIERIYGKGERIVRQGDAGSSMFVIGRGRVRVVASGVELAVIDAGGYVGEMSMLTGQARSATVEVLEECEALELTSDALREVALANPEVVMRISAVVGARQADLERQTAQAAAAQSAMTSTQRPLLVRIQEFLRLPNLLGR